jgi:trans-2,3-dihydro-3-hydroxyanthranilate isomerase
MRIPFRLVDVFTDRPLAGNQLCVVPDPVDVPTDVMQAIALEMGFSETTFVTEAGADRYAMRIFTPASELPFAGHPTLGTAFVLVSEGRVRTPCVQTVPAGEFAVEVAVLTGSARMRQHGPEFGRMVEREAAARALGLSQPDLHPALEPQVVSTGIGHLMVGVENEGAVGRARPDPAPLEELLHRAGVDGVYVFHPSGQAARARLFFLAVGIKEDAATGSAAGPLGAYLAERGVIAPGRLTITQGIEIGRPSTLRVDVGTEQDGWSIHVGGGVAKVGEGWFDLPG